LEARGTRDQPRKVRHHPSLLVLYPWPFSNKCTWRDRMTSQLAQRETQPELHGQFSSIGLRREERNGEQASHGIAFEMTQLSFIMKKHLTVKSTNCMTLYNQTYALHCACDCTYIIMVK